MAMTGFLSALPFANDIAFGGFASFHFNTRTTGTVLVVERDGKLFLELGEDFSVKSAPDLHVLLSPLGQGQLTDDNASTGAVVVAMLETFEGAKSFELDAGTPVGQFRTVLIHCIEFRHLFGIAALDFGSSGVTANPLVRSQPLRNQTGTNSFDLRGRYVLAPFSPGAAGLIMGDRGAKVLLRSRQNNQAGCLKTGHPAG